MLSPPAAAEPPLPLEALAKAWRDQAPTTSSSSSSLASSTSSCASDNEDGCFMDLDLEEGYAMQRIVALQHHQARHHHHHHAAPPAAHPQHQGAQPARAEEDEEQQEEEPPSSPPPPQEQQQQHRHAEGFRYRRVRLASCRLLRATPGAAAARGTQKPEMQDRHVHVPDILHLAARALHQQRLERERQQQQRQQHQRQQHPPHASRQRWQPSGAQAQQLQAPHIASSRYYPDSPAGDESDSDGEGSTPLSSSSSSSSSSAASALLPPVAQRPAPPPPPKATGQDLQGLLSQAAEQLQHSQAALDAPHHHHAHNTSPHQPYQGQQQHHRQHQHQQHAPAATTVVAASLTGVFDGHSGSRTSRFAAQRLPELVAASEQLWAALGAPCLGGQPLACQWGAGLACVGWGRAGRHLPGCLLTKALALRGCFAAQHGNTACVRVWVVVVLAEGAVYPDGLSSAALSLAAGALHDVFAQCDGEILARDQYKPPGEFDGATALLGLQVRRLGGERTAETPLRLSPVRSGRPRLAGAVHGDGAGPQAHQAGARAGTQSRVAFLALSLSSPRRWGRTGCSLLTLYRWRRTWCSRLVPRRSGRTCCWPTWATRARCWGAAAAPCA